MLNINMSDQRKIFLVSRCAWNLHNFRAGLMRELSRRGYDASGVGAGDDGFAERVERLGIPFNDLPVDKKGHNPFADVKLLFALYHWYHGHFDCRSALHFVEERFQ